MKITKFLPILIFIFLLVPFVAQAFFFPILSNVCTSQCGSLMTSPNAFKLCCFITKIGNILYIIGWALAFIVIIVGGITYMTAGGNEERVKKGRKIITNGLIGTGIVLASGFILDILREFLMPLFY